jgi:hypothetical protein
LIGGSELESLKDDADEADDASDVDTPASSRSKETNAMPMVANFRPPTALRVTLMYLVVFVMKLFLVREG